MHDVLARIRGHWLAGLAVVVLALLWIVAFFEPWPGVRLLENVTILVLSIGGGLVAASVAPEHPLRNGMVGGGALLALAGVALAVYRAAAGTVNVGEYGGSWASYWLLSLLICIPLAAIGAVLGYVGGYIVRFASHEHPRAHPV